MKTLLARKKTNHGETIVEVLLAIAILSGVLGFAFASASRSSKNIQANKERFQATLLANEQASLLKANSDDINIRKTTKFCFKNDTNYTVQTNDVPADYATHCTGRGSPSVYTIEIKGLNADCNPIKKTCTYSVIVKWDSIKGGSEPDMVEVFYVV